MSSPTLYNRKATAAALHENINNPPTHLVTREAHYNVSPGTPPTFIAFSGTTSRLAIQHNTGGIGIGDIPYKIQIPYRRIGNPTGNLSVGIADTIEVACSTGLPSGFTSQQFTGSYGATANPLAVKITSSVDSYLVS